MGDVPAACCINHFLLFFFFVSDVAWLLVVESVY